MDRRSMISGTLMSLCASALSLVPGFRNRDKNAEPEETPESHGNESEVGMSFLRENSYMHSSPYFPKPIKPVVSGLSLSYLPTPRGGVDNDLLVTVDMAAAEGSEVQLQMRIRRECSPDGFSQARFWIGHILHAYTFEDEDKKRLLELSLRLKSAQYSCAYNALFPQNW